MHLMGGTEFDSTGQMKTKKVKCKNEDSKIKRKPSLTFVKKKRNTKKH